MLTDQQLRDFARDGFVKVDRAFPPDLAAECEALLWERLREQGSQARPGRPGTWTRPVEWISGMDAEPFVRAANTEALHEAFDQLVGAGRWGRRTSLGAFPLRFPHHDEPDDAGWHVEGSFRDDADGPYRTNVYSRERALLMLFLFTGVDEGDAPTRVRVGSHLDVPEVLERYGERGLTGPELSPLVERASRTRPTTLATGRPGDVYLCHPFLVHAAQPHHGDRPRFMAQPPLYLRQPLRLDPNGRADGAYSIVELTVRDALGARTRQ